MRKTFFIISLLVSLILNPLFFESSAEDIDSLENEVSTIKKEIFRINSHLKLIRDRINIDSSASAFMQISQKYLVSDSYKLISTRYFLDNFEIYQEITEKGRKASETPYYIFEGSILPGSHTLRIEMILENNEGFISSKSYLVKLEKECLFEAKEGETLNITTISSYKNEEFKIRFEPLCP